MRPARMIDAGQLDPAALYGADVMVVGSVEIADQDAGSAGVESLVHRGLTPVPPQEVSVGVLKVQT